MAAPTKEGIDYFSFDVDLLDDDDFDFLRESYGLIINDVYIGLLTLLYREKGYYVPYETEEDKEKCVWYLYKRVRGGKHSVQKESIPTVIEALVSRGKFSRSHYPKIITSERAQKTYYKATVERKIESFNIIPEYWMLNEETMRKLSKVHPYYLFLYPESKSDGNQSKSDGNQSKSDDLSESKVKDVSNDTLEERKKEIDKNNHQPNFSEMTDEELAEWAENPQMEFIDENFYEIYEKCLEERKRRIEKNSFNGKVTKGLYRLQSYDEVMDFWKVSETVKIALKSFLQHCALNKHICTNDKLVGIIHRLNAFYGIDDKGKVESLQRAISGGYYDIKEGKR